ncbi:hypothetical protein PSEUDO8Z_10451 [Pseudomonas sp. 8Z]|nr:hypothetical protein PSEUDO8Z_10451 [Pseudomonas sp. 8Z]
MLLEELLQVLELHLVDLTLLQSLDRFECCIPECLDPGRLFGFGLQQQTQAGSDNFTGVLITAGAYQALDRLLQWFREDNVSGAHRAAPVRRNFMAYYAMCLACGRILAYI